MAFTKTPTVSTYQTKFIPLVYAWDSRRPQIGVNLSDSPDSYSKNVIMEPVTNEKTGEKIYHAYKRDGADHLQWRAAPFPSPFIDDFTLPVIGVHNNTSNNLLIVLTSLNPASLTTNFHVLEEQPNGQVRVFNGSFATGLNGGVQLQFADFVYDSGEQATFVSVIGNSDLCKLKLSGGFASSVSGVLPASHNGDLVALDGYMFCSTPKGDIFNSNLNDPLTWSASNFISAESYGDGLVRIARSGSYIVAFGTDSIEFFYDAANPTGSPLAVYPGATKRIGYLGGVTQVGDTLYFVGRYAGSAPTLYKVEGLKVTPIIDFTQSRSWGNNFTDSFERATGNIIKLNGHTLYVWWSASNDAFPIVYDLDVGLFLSLSFKDLDLDIIQSDRVFCRTDDNRVYFYSPPVYQDDGVNYTVYLQTNNEDFDSRRNKFANRALIHADQPTSNSNIQLSWTVDDYKTLSTPRSINLNDVYPSASNLGLFRKIAFHLEYADNFPMRIAGIELDYQIGDS